MTTVDRHERRGWSPARWILAGAVVLAVIVGIVLLVTYTGGGSSGGGY